MPRIVDRGSFPDLRLADRCGLLRKLFLFGPDAPIPQATGGDAGTEAAYRFLENDRVEPSMVMDQSWSEVQGRVRGRDVIVPSDSTSIAHKTAADAADTYDLGGGEHGYVGHATLVVGESDGEVLGVPALSFIRRKKSETQQPKEGSGKRPRWADPTSESARWLKQAEFVDQRLREAGAGQVIHVMDREADVFETMFQMRERGLDFIIRAAQGHRKVGLPLEEGQTEQRSVALDATVPLAVVEAERAVRLSRRKRPGSKDAKTHPPREERDAKLTISAISVTVKRPERAPKSWPEEFPLQVVHVIETDPPEGEEPIRWTLWTTLPIATEAQVLRIVDAYRRRWRIEELFKALKTGCKFEERRFETAATSQRAMAIYIGIAAEILRLRCLCHEVPDQPAEGRVDPVHIEVLRVVVPQARLPAAPTVREVYRAIAMLGGHLKHNGSPGWHVLARGYEDLLKFAIGWRVARQLASATVY